jgi:hypothetical protein
MRALADWLIAESIRIKPYTSTQFIYRLTRLHNKKKNKKRVFLLDSKVGPSITFEITKQLLITYNHKYKMVIPTVLSTKHCNLLNFKTYGDKDFPPEDDQVILETSQEFDTVLFHICKH